MTDGLLLPPGGGRKIQTMTLKAGAEQSKHRIAGSARNCFRAGEPGGHWRSAGSGPQKPHRRRS